MRVLIVDDQPVLRRGLCDLLKPEKTPRLDVAGEAADGRGVVDTVARKKIDLVILELSLPGGNGLDVLADLKRCHLKVAVLIYTMCSEEEYGVRALRAGAAGFLRKRESEKEIIHAMRIVAAGGKYMSATLQGLLITASQSDRHCPPHELLSDREFEVFRLIAQGFSNIEMSRTLGVSPSTITTYRTRIMEKTGMRNNAEVTRYRVQMENAA